MHREKLLLSSVYLLASLFASLSVISLIPQFVSQALLAAQLGAAAIILTPIIGMVFLWRQQFTTPLQARRFSFLLWGSLLTLLGLANFLFNKQQESATATTMMGVIMALIGLILIRKEKKLALVQKIETASLKQDN